MLSQDALQAITDYFAAQAGAQADAVLVAYLFGSHARGEAHALSDVDVAVLLPEGLTPKQRLERRMDIIADLAAILGTNDVDVAVLNDASLALGYRVLRDGRLLYCGDEEARVLHRAFTVTRYLDFEPILNRHYQAIIERAKTGNLNSGHNPYRGALERYRQRAGRTE